jgi:hypothetical protein
MSSLTYRALSALPPALQTLARQHVMAHPSDDIDDVISEVAVAALEIEGADAERIFARARSRLRRATQDVAHYAAGIDDAHHDIERDDPSLIRRADIVREVAARQHVTARRAQQIVKSQIARAQIIGDLFMAEGGAV